MPDLHGTNGVSRTHFKNTLRMEQSLFIENLYELQDILASRQNHQVGEVTRLPMVVYLYS